MASKNKTELAVIVGTRPNFVKAAPFFKEAKKHPEFKLTLIHTGQHYDNNMSKIFFKELGLPNPNVSLDIKGELFTEKIGKMFNALSNFFAKNQFAAVILFGDVNSTLAGAIAASKNNQKIFHIESGLRSHDRRMPEEINRAIVDHLSDLLFTTEKDANANLTKEGISKSKIKFVGNIMIESLEIFKDKIENADILNKLNLKPKDYLIATIHRQENTDDPIILKKILEILSTISSRFKIVFPLHPGTNGKILNFGFESYLKNFQIIEPQGYFEFLKLVKESRGVITDSGGIQEETSHMRVPCCTLRDNTERPITLKLGSNKLFPIETANAKDVILHLEKKTFKKQKIPLWDSGVTARIFTELENYFKLN